MSQNKTIVHVDINSYFATILQQENPKLRGRPIGVVKEEGRTCVIAASKEAKTYGVKTGSTLKEAKERCSSFLTVPAAFERYLDATYRLKKVFETIAPDVYIYSLDEAFIDITACRKNLYPDLHALGDLIQTRIKKELGEWVTANVGISHNRFLAKMTSEVAPKGSITFATAKNQDALLASVPFKDVCGIGSRLERKLHLLNIHTPYQIRFFKEEDLEPIFGPFWSKELLKMAWGKEPHHLKLIDRELPHMKSVGRSITGFKLAKDEATIKTVLYNLTEEVAFKVRQMSLVGRRVSIRLHGSDPTERFRAHRTLKRPIRHTQDMFDIIYHQLYRSWPRSFPIIKFAVRLSLLKPYKEVSLLPEWKKQEKIYQAKDAVNQKYGLFTLRSARLSQRSIIRPEVTGFLGDAKYLGLR